MNPKAFPRMSWVHDLYPTTKRSERSKEIEMHPPIAELVRRLLITIAPCNLSESILVRWGF
jgi:hypothetical protein